MCKEKDVQAIAGAKKGYAKKGYAKKGYAKKGYANVQPQSIWVASIN